MDLLRWGFGTLEGKGDSCLLIDDNFPVGQQIGFLNDVSMKSRRHKCIVRHSILPKELKRRRAKANL